MRIIYTSDLHGDIKLYESLAERIKEEKAEHCLYWSLLLVTFLLQINKNISYDFRD